MLVNQEEVTVINIYIYMNEYTAVISSSYFWCQVTFWECCSYLSWFRWLFTINSYCFDVFTLGDLGELGREEPEQEAVLGSPSNITIHSPPPLDRQLDQWLSPYTATQFPLPQFSARKNSSWKWELTAPVLLSFIWFLHFVVSPEWPHLTRTYEYFTFHN